MEETLSRTLRRKPRCSRGSCGVEAVARGKPCGPTVVGFQMTSVSVHGRGDEREEDTWSCLLNLDSRDLD